MVGFYNQPDTDEMAVRPLRQELSAVPASKVINLDTYCEGYHRDQVAMMKRWIKRYFPHLPPAVAMLKLV